MPTETDRADDLSAQQWQAIGAWLRTGDAQAAADAAGVSARTFRRWRALPAFRAAVRDVGRDHAHTAASRVLSVQGHAVNTLVRALDSPAWPVRVSAARSLLDYGQAITDHDLSERLADLERRLDEWHDPTAPPQPGLHALPPA